MAESAWPVAASMRARSAPMSMVEFDQLLVDGLQLTGAGVELVDGVGQLELGRRGEVVVDEAVVDLVGDAPIDQFAHPVPVALAEHPHHLMDREQSGVPLGDQVLDQGQALAGPGDGEGHQDTEEKGGHAGQCDIDPHVAPVGPTEMEVTATTKTHQDRRERRRCRRRSPMSKPIGGYPAHGHGRALHRLCQMSQGIHLARRRGAGGRRVGGMDRRDVRP